MLFLDDSLQVPPALSFVSQLNFTEEFEYLFLLHFFHIPLMPQPIPSAFCPIFQADLLLLVYPITSLLLHKWPLLGPSYYSSQVYCMWWPCPRRVWNIGYFWLCYLVSLSPTKVLFPSISFAGLPFFIQPLNIYLIMLYMLPRKFLPHSFSCHHLHIKNSKFISSANSYTLSSRLLYPTDALTSPLLSEGPFIKDWSNTRPSPLGPARKCGLLGVTTLGD